MPPFYTGRGGGSSQRDLGLSPNTFGDDATANRAEAEALRDAQAGDAAWLAFYGANRAFYVLLTWNGGEALQRRNVAGDDWEDVTGIITGPRGANGPAHVAQIVRFWGVGQAEALPAGESDRSGLVTDNIRGAIGKMLRYRAGQAMPNDVVGVDPGIRALAAADVSDADLAALAGGGDEVLPDFAVFSVPAGVLCEGRLHAQHDVASDVSFAGFLYEVQAGSDRVRLTEGVGYTSGRADPLGVLTPNTTPRTSVKIGDRIDARMGEKLVTFFAAGFQVNSDASGHWYFEFKVIPHA